MKVTIDIANQSLELTDDQGAVLERYPISSALNGLGEEAGSYCTPRGRHIIRAKIGGGQPINAVFVRRRPTGEVYTPELGNRFPERDWILTRILWLSGCEPGRNRLGNVDSMRRFIYIHGTADEAQMGRSVSKGCIRMRNTDILDLFDRVEVGTPVVIMESPD